MFFPQRLLRVCPLVLVDAFDSEDRLEMSSGWSGSTVFSRSSILASMVVKKAIISGYCDSMFCRAMSEPDIELIGLGPWSVGSTAFLCCWADGAPGMVNLCTFS